MQIKSILIVLIVAWLTACSSKPPPEPVVVFASNEDETDRSSLFAEFTETTGIPVAIHDDNSATNTLNVINNVGAPPADVLLTTTVVDIWRAADRGALRPIQTERLATRPANLRDSNNFWVALEYRTAVIAWAKKPGDASPPVPLNYADLAEPQYRGQLCLSSSELQMNRSMIAMMIADLGSRPAELVVRGWMQNLARPPFATESQLLAAIKSGECGFGVLADSVATGVEITVPQDAFFDVDAIGIARHARNPESAQKLLDWLLARNSLSLPPEASTRNLQLAGWHDDDARQLVERAGYR